ncbi:MAG: GTP-binding protein [Verrucomicrobiales bacterium]|jgi:GTP-binding protein
MKITSAEFVKSARDLESCPESDLGEMAFIGRSNVGKSSLINLLAERNGLAKTSSTPGRTTLINFFRINNSWTLVDLPGYGYAKRSKADQAEFNEFVSDFLVNRPNLICAFVLIDAKIPPQRLDLEFVEWIVNNEIPFALIFTKTDKTKPDALSRNIASFKGALAERCDGVPKVLAASTKSKKGRLEVLNFIEKAVAVRR